MPKGNPGGYRKRTFRTGGPGPTPHTKKTAPKRKPTVFKGKTFKSLGNMPIRSVSHLKKKK